METNENKEEVKSEIENTSVEKKEVKLKKVKPSAETIELETKQLHVSNHSGIAGGYRK